MANNTQSEVKGIGKIRVTNVDGVEVILTDVRHMPNISRNIISYGLLEKAGCTYEGGGFKIEFYKASETCNRTLTLLHYHSGEKGKHNKETNSNNQSSLYTGFFYQRINRNIKDSKIAYQKVKSRDHLPL